MRLLRLLSGIIFGLTGVLVFANNPFAGGGLALLGGAMVLDASFEPKIPPKDTWLR
ncbi:hypothetical protein [Desulfoferrobacter suflitae]|uniref:hypothetical protein n=1 Tax=Desulfoferrobacter suflitae TaxID=2865782 RepID=UPI0021641264|nr:hypothetical protein [Desulfoferrobacter suflitae]MCK8601518.1 hypothetical protein [Desulfoferrobacter suflitae]